MATLTITPPFAVPLTADKGGTGHAGPASATLTLAGQSYITDVAATPLAIGGTASGAQLTVAASKNAVISNSLTLAGTDGTTMTFPASSTTVAGLGIANAFTVSGQSMADSSTTAILTLSSTHITGSAPLIITATAVTGGALIYAQQSTSTTNSSFAGLWLDMARGSGTFSAGYFLLCNNNTVTKASLDSTGSALFAGSLSVGGSLQFDSSGFLQVSNVAVGSVSGTATLGKVPAGQTSTAQNGWWEVKIGATAYRIPLWLYS